VQNATNVYVKSGPYTVKELVISSFGCKDSLIKKIRVLPDPVVKFSYLPSCVGAQLFFQNQVVDSTTKTKYVWDFGDATATSSASAPAHVFAANGTFNTKLKVISGNGCADSTTHPVTPNPKPNPKITYVPNC